MTATHNSLCDDLSRLGVEPGDLVMVHASMRAIGPVAGGADTVIGAILDTLGPSGTMVMVIGTEHAGRESAKHLPQCEQLKALETLPPVDIRTAPADPQMGALAEAFRQTSGVVTGLHPEARFAASGPLAEQLVADIPLHDYLGPGSPLDRLCDQKGKILRMGADDDTVTALHLAEYYAGVADKRRISRHYHITDDAGPRVVRVDSLDDCNGIAPWKGDGYFGDILNEFLARGRATCGRVGRARCELFNANDIVCFGSKWMTAHLNPKAAAR